MGKQKTKTKGCKHFWQFVRIEDLALSPEKWAYFVCGGCGAYKKILLKELQTEETKLNKE